MGIEQIVEESSERTKKTIGSALGVIIGGVLGFLETAVLPSYVVSQITRDDRYPAYDAIWLGKDFPNGTREYVRTVIVMREMTRLGLIFGIGVDFADGKADNVGYLAIPMAVSALYEIYRAVRKEKE